MSHNVQTLKPLSSPRCLMVCPCSVCLSGEQVRQAVGGGVPRRQVIRVPGAGGATPGGRVYERSRGQPRRRKPSRVSAGSSFIVATRFTSLCTCASYVVPRLHVGRGVRVCTGFCREVDVRCFGVLILGFVVRSTPPVFCLRRVGLSESCMAGASLFISCNAWGT